MHQLVEGLHGVQAVKEYFVVVGFGDSEEKASVFHVQNVDAFLQLCQERGLKLNPEKVQHRKKEVLFIGYVATGQGLRADPAKVRASAEMPQPTNVAAVRWLMGLSQYLSKFLRHHPTSQGPCKSSPRRKKSELGIMQERALDALK